MSRTADASIRGAPLVCISSTTSSGVSTMPSDVGQRSADDRGRNVAVRDRGERDRGLHGRRDQAQEQHAGVEAGGQHRGHETRGRPARAAGSDERRGKHQQMQPPVPQPVPGLACGDSRAPYSKNSSAMATLVAIDRTSATVPRAGNSAASDDRGNRASRKVSIGTASPAVGQHGDGSVTDSVQRCAGPPQPAVGCPRPARAQTTLALCQQPGRDGTDRADDAHDDDRRAPVCGCGQGHGAAGGEHDRGGQLSRRDRAQYLSRRVAWLGPGQRPQPRVRPIATAAHRHSTAAISMGHTIRARSRPAGWAVPRAPGFARGTTSTRLARQLRQCRLGRRPQETGAGPVPGVAVRVPAGPGSARP